MYEPTADGKDISLVSLNHDLTAIVIDHVAKTQHAWSLIDGKWVEADIVDALHEGGIIHGKTLDGLPPLPL